jgi:hypothetical protein
MTSNAKHISNIIYWWTYAFVAYQLSMAGVFIGRWIYGAHDLSPPVITKFITAVICGIGIAPHIIISAKAILANRDTGKVDK